MTTLQTVFHSKRSAVLFGFSLSMAIASVAGCMVTLGADLAIWLVGGVPKVQPGTQFMLNTFDHPFVFWSGPILYLCSVILLPRPKHLLLVILFGLLPLLVTVINVYFMYLSHVMPPRTPIP